MASVVGKRINGRTYYYLVESARVDGRPRVVSQRYLGTAEDIANAVAEVSLVDAFDRGTGTDLRRGASPDTARYRSRHRPFGDVAAVWGVLGELDAEGVVDRAVGRQRAKVGAGRLVAVAVLRRAAAPASGSASGQETADPTRWWPSTAAERFVKPRLTPALLGRSAFRRAFRRVAGRVEEVEQAFLTAILDQVGADAPVLVLDVPNLGPAGTSGALGRSVRPTNPAEPASQPGGPMERAEPDPGRPKGLGLVVTLDGAVPLVGELYAPDSTSFVELATRLVARYRDAGGRGSATVVADAGQNALDLLWPRLRGQLADAASAGHAGVHAVGALSPHDHPELAALPLSGFASIDPDRFPGVIARDTRARVAGAERRCIVVHSASLHEAQARALAADLAHAERRLAELAAVLDASGTRPPPRDRVAAEVARIVRFRWGERLLATRLTGDRSGALRLEWSVDEGARARLENERFGRQLLVTDHEDWPVARVLTAYRARYRVEATLRHLQAGGEADGLGAGDAHGFRDERLDTLLTVLATAVTHLLRHRAQEAGIDVSARELMQLLAGIQETEVRAPSTGGRPRTVRLLAECTPVQRRLLDLFDLHRYAPRPTNHAT